MMWAEGHNEMKSQLRRKQKRQIRTIVTYLHFTFKYQHDFKDLQSHAVVASQYLVTPNLPLEKGNLASLLNIHKLISLATVVTGVAHTEAFGGRKFNTNTSILLRLWSFFRWALSTNLAESGGYVPQPPDCDSLSLSFTQHHLWKTSKTILIIMTSPKNNMDS